MTTIDYTSFVERKLALRPPSGIASDFMLPASMFPHQQALSSWALRRGRAAIFADTGLGKSRMEIAWADTVSRHTGMPVLILTPLAVAPQTADEGTQIGVDVAICREQADVRPGINVTNYDRLHKFDTTAFGGVVLDESSIIKHHDARTFSALTAAFRDTPFKLPATATPAPNDWTELGTHAEFLGICTRAEMLSEFFTHDGGNTSVWRLKGHARRQFWRWVSSWGALVRRPSDLGFNDSAYALPPLRVHEHLVDHGFVPPGYLLPVEAQTLTERREARRATLESRVARCAAIINEQPNEAGIVWCDLNDEQDALEDAFGDRAFSVRGADSIDDKEDRIVQWLAGERPIIVSKPSILGFGLNMQRAARMAFVGVTDSYESYYQAVRRCWRFGQRREVHVHIIASAAEGAVVSNIKRKERDAIDMAEKLSAETRDAIMGEVIGAHREYNEYSAGRRVTAPDWLRSAA